MPADALLLLGHGTPESLDDVPAFVSNIRRGRPTPASVIAEVQARYRAIGGRSPLLSITRAQAALLANRVSLPCFVAMRMWHPTFRETLLQIAPMGFRRLLVVAMAPHSAPIYASELEETSQQLRSQGIAVPDLVFASSLGDEPALIDTHVQFVREALGSMSGNHRARALLVPTAHSLPMRVVEQGDTYPQRVERTVNAWIERLGADALPMILAYQSQGLASEPWLGPDLPNVFARAQQTGCKGVVVVPIGFLADHVETLYDLDIEAQRLASRHDLWFQRTACPNCSSQFINALENVVRPLLSPPPGS